MRRLRNLQVKSLARLLASLLEAAVQLNRIPTDDEHRAELDQQGVTEFGDICEEFVSTGELDKHRLSSLYVSTASSTMKDFCKQLSKCSSAVDSSRDCLRLVDEFAKGDDGNFSDSGFQEAYNSSRQNSTGAESFLVQFATCNDLVSELIEGIDSELDAGARLSQSPFGYHTDEDLVFCVQAHRLDTEDVWVPYFQAGVPPR